jgi:hypothetical protein
MWNIFTVEFENITLLVGVKWLEEGLTLFSASLVSLKRRDAVVMNSETMRHFPQKIQRSFSSKCSTILDAGSDMNV